MEAGGEPVHELMRDVKAVDWLPLDRAVNRLSRGYERDFLKMSARLHFRGCACRECGKRGPNNRRGKAPDETAGRERASGDHSRACFARNRSAFAADRAG